MLENVFLHYVACCCQILSVFYPAAQLFHYFLGSFLLAESETRVALPSFFHFNESIFSSHNQKMQFLCFLLKKKDLFFPLKFCCCSNVKQPFYVPVLHTKDTILPPTAVIPGLTSPRSSSSFFQTYLSLHAQSSLPFLPKASHPGAGKLFNCSSETGEISRIACWVVFGSSIMDERFDDLLQVFCGFAWLTLQFFSAFSS